MKFGKHLQSQIDDSLPEWRDKYLSYKRLKKRLKLLLPGAPPPPRCCFTPPLQSPLPDSRSLSDTEISIAADDIGGTGGRSSPNSSSESSSCHASSSTATAKTVEVADDDSAQQRRRRRRRSERVAGGEGRSCNNNNINMTDEELDFVRLLNAEVEKFNAFFMEKEEEYVIRLQELKERIEGVRAQSRPTSSEGQLNEEMLEMRKDFVSFHGEMVLLESYSLLNYTGLTKILKKHDRHTGAVLRTPFIQKVLRQPFYTTELLSKLVCECEETLHSLFPAPLTEKNNPGSSQEMALFQGQDFEKIYKGTIAALTTLRDLRKGSSTYNLFSLPPIAQNDEDVINVSASHYLSTPTPVCPNP